MSNKLTTDRVKAKLQKLFTTGQLCFMTSINFEQIFVRDDK